MQVLRCHTSAHQAELLRKGEKSFLVTGDVYRRDSIDASHYPVFHQMEGLYVLSDEEIEASGKSGTQLASEDLKFVLSGLTKHLFGDVEMKFVDAYFPFTVSCMFGMLVALAGIAHCCSVNNSKTRCVYNPLFRAGTLFLCLLYSCICSW